jgi:hypothetical protein
MAICLGKIRDFGQADDFVGSNGTTNDPCGLAV